MDARVLVLNSAYIPLNSVSWKRAVCLIYQQKADVIYEKERIIRSPSIEMKMPSVIRLRYTDIIPKIKIKYNKKNIYLRDNYTCQYCGKKLSSPGLTIDHVIPKRLDGTSSWGNTTTCCFPCNMKKSGKTPKQAGMKLLSKPTKPHYYPYLFIKKYANESDIDLWKQFFVI